MWGSELRREFREREERVIDGCLLPMPWASALTWEGLRSNFLKSFGQDSVNSFPPPPKLSKRRGTMALSGVKGGGTKRKQESRDTEETGIFSNAVEMEMLSDEEGEEQGESDDGGVDEFPVLDVASDSESDEEDEGTDEEDEEDEEDEFSSDDDSIHIFPKAKTVISDITGQEKRVYPEIEPNYDSDSSTEDVSLSYTSRCGL